MSILQRLGLGSSNQERPELLEAIEEQLSRLEPARAELIAAFAGLLARVAYADDEISEPEVLRMERLIARQTGVSDDEARAISMIARQKTIALRGMENYLLTRRFNELASEEEKRGLIDCLYAVATADDLVTYVEDREIRKIADALLIAPSELQAIRAPYREKLEELQLLRKARSPKP